jgi:hypothetical protein
MIISASRRTDIPAFYSGWLVNRLRAGHLTIVNPFNPNQTRRLDLTPESVDCIVFWTRNSQPLMKYLDEIDRMGYRYYFLYTITGYPSALEENLPSLEKSLELFKELSGRVGPEQVIWRYDPIVFSSITGKQYHIDNFQRISSELEGYTCRCIISFVDLYRKVKTRIKRIFNKSEIRLSENPPELCLEIASRMRRVADDHKMTIQSCAEDIDLTPAGIAAGSCIDGDLVTRICGTDLSLEKDPHQRALCLCAKSVDIGAYNTCGYRCIYCYANTSFATALDNIRRFDHNNESLYIGRLADR